MVHKELKRAILEWMLENENTWQRTNAAVEAFREYIYDSKGNYLIGGKEVAEFIMKAEDLLYE